VCGDRLTDDFEFDAERGFAGAVLEQQSVSAGVGAFYATESQRRGVVYRLHGRPRRRARQLRLTVPPATNKSPSSSSATTTTLRGPLK